MSLGEERLDRWEIAKEIAGMLEEDKEADFKKLMEARKKKFFLKDHLFSVPEGKMKFYSGEIERRVIDYDQPGVTIEETKLTIFGADYLSNPELKTYFDGKVKKSKWLDQSTVIVEFSSTVELNEALRKHLRVPIDEAEEISSKSKLSHNSEEYELVYYHKVQERRLIARYTVSDDYNHVKPVNPQEETDELCKDIYLEKEHRKRHSLLPRKKFIRKEQERRYETRHDSSKHEHSRLSFSRNGDQVCRS